MKVLEVRNVNEALPRGVALLRAEGVRRDSRNGPVLLCPQPVCTHYRNPWERVLFSPARDANPFMHLYEALWMLAGKDDVASVARYAKQLAAYSDDGVVMPGAYGRRWRRWFVQGAGETLRYRDQIQWAINRLRKDPNDRRVVISMWDPNVDLERADNGGKDVPCNTQLYVWVNTGGELCMTITCRSNDIIWGAYGANAVHFSLLQEHIAMSLGLGIGGMWQISNNYHAYVEVLERYEERYAALKSRLDDPYALDPTLCDLVGFGVENAEDVVLEDLKMFLDEKVTLGLRTTWLRKVAHPVVAAHLTYSEKADKQRFEKALEIIQRCAAPDWRRVCTEWLGRRQEAHRRAVDDGPTQDT